MMNVKKSFSKKQLTDSGLALLFLTLLSGIWVAPDWVIKAAIAEVLVLMVAPVLVYPFSFIWLNLSELLGKTMSKVILVLIFVVVVCPVGIIRRAMGKDSLLLKRFRRDCQSVFKDRSTTNKVDFTASF